MLSEDLLDVAWRQLAALDTPLSLGVALRLQHGMEGAISEIKVDPLTYLNAESYFLDAQAVALLKKAEFFATDPSVLESQAVERFYNCERQCFWANRRLYRVSAGFEPDARYARYLSAARGKLRRWLGAVPPLEDWFFPRYGKGATVSHKSLEATVPHKIASSQTLTGPAAFVLPWFWETAAGRVLYESRGEFAIHLVDGNKFFTVPKDVTKRRCCAKEPSLNLHYQLTLGLALRRRLKRAGIDLENADVIHRELARSASVTGAYATIDLSDASDCIAWELVKALMPHDWFELLNRLRSPITRVEGRPVVLEKFSSMGNGFTFELETCLFLALICALDPGLIPGYNVWVKGDDIIVPTEFSRAVLGALQWAGATPNVNKTFTTGYFRESCGGDYFLGRDVRPFYWKENIDEPHRLITVANGIRRYMGKIDSPRISRRLRAAWFGVLDRMPSRVRACRGPTDLGDIVIHDEVSKWCTKEKDSIRYLKCWKPAQYDERFKLVRWGPGVQMASLLYGVQLHGDPKTDSRRCVIPRDGVIGYDVGWVPFS